jgi:adenylate cyclase
VLDSRQLFLEAELAAERTVAQLRFFVAAILGLAFAVAVLAQLPREDAVLVRQGLLAAATIVGYALLGALSLWLLRRRQFRRWMAWAFVTGDAVLLLGSLQLAVINTGLPSAYIAAFPAAWLLPVILTFGALRYDPALQAYLATILIVGLGVIIAASPIVPGAAGDPAASPFVRFFQTPPNTMRLVMIALAGIVLVIAAARARRLLRRAVDEAARRANLTRYLPPQIADWLAETSVEELRRGRRQNVAVLFVDIRDFTARAEGMDPAALGTLLTAFRALVAAAAHEQGGMVDKFIGDSVMVVFGVPRSDSADARRALDCARSVLTRLAAGQDRIEVGIGAHYGEAFCGAVGDEARLEFTVIGDTVNIAARLQELTKSAGLPVIASQALLEAAGANLAAWTALPPQKLRGRHQPTAPYGTDGVMRP